MSTCLLEADNVVFLKLISLAKYSKDILPRVVQNVVNEMFICGLYIEFMKNRERLNMTLLRNTQGLHAPLKLSMELRAAEKVGHLPFLPSSGLMRDVLMGRDEEIGFEDILSIPEFNENLCKPHAMVEKHLGIL
ncbi:hypothetical protein PR048_029901 [Dryococelus australis]|uniref:Proteasome maturation protein n=1 Tax=Dryococelus australis TaxID=614101 RepID=A0ABQ9G7G6_9NEOP|nr:hypothetical protein PR048_029901 [Dryococelus australis]